MSDNDKSVDELLLDLKDELSEENSLDENISDLKTELAKYKCDLEQAYNRLDKTENQLKKAKKYNEELRSQVEKLSSELHNYRHAAKNREEVSVQVDKEDLLKFSAGEISLPDWTRDGTGQINAKTDDSKGKDPGNGIKSIAETLKATAEAAVKQTGFIYDENTGLYYDHNSGYYYDSEKSLYYDPRTGTYFYYNNESGHYEFHSQVDLSYYTDSSRHYGGQSHQHHHYLDHDQCQDHPIPGTSREERRYQRRKDKEQLKKSDRNHPDLVKKEELNEDHRKKKRRKNKKKKFNKENNSEKKSENIPDRKLRAKNFDSTDKNEFRKFKKRERRRKRRQRKKQIEEAARKESNQDKDFKGQISVELKDDSKICPVIHVDTLAHNEDQIDSDMQAEIFEKQIEKKLLYETTEETPNMSSSIKNHNKSNATKGVNDNSTKEGTKSDKQNKSIENKRDDITLDSGAIFNISDDMNVDVSDSFDLNSNSNANNNSCRDTTGAILISSSSEESDEESELESGELSDSSSDSDLSSFSSSESDSESSFQSVEDMQVEDEIAAGNWPPCIRMIASESGCLDVGTLFIVTCTGATIGREKDMNHTVIIPDVNVSKTHAEIKYDQQRKEYLIVDLGSQNGTYLNCKRLSQAKAASEPVAISHGDQIQFGDGTKLLCHIHPGTDTCDDCEPGQVRAQWQAKNEPKKEIVFLSKEEKQRQHKEQLRQIKQKYGLKNVRYVDNMAAIKNPGYTDKADERRQTVGSDNPHQKEPEEVPASVHRPISSGNIGHKLLKKMGWNEGESLGKTNTGIQEPVRVTIRSNQLAGLGSSGNLFLSPENPESEDNKKAVRRVLAQKRFDQISKKSSGYGGTTSQIAWLGGGIITAEQPQDTSS
ncbi:hypothetical protein CHS0354_025079 [Potamilus streckersoni]|uniref:Angiogenic factor with G patch and FHA domains 1 n=1 Tax=Potamilus streckersoni TaxID=2493646 RepID=A0AAE0T956_9BIVA|nr:hypothetical protein CHS0354_025079 [Potamilus streckersoni]